LSSLRFTQLPTRSASVCQEMSRGMRLLAEEEGTVSRPRAE
jgi:hypothetical protein